MWPEKAAAQRIVDRYVLHEEMASGGMAVVHFGQVLGAGGFARTVAIKRLHPHFAKDPEFSGMFLDEARLAARVRHPNVVTTLDVVATDSELCLVMEYVAGEALSAVLRESRKQSAIVPAAIVASIMSGALRGLHAAHEARGEDGHPLDIVHRDVSPQNLLVGQDGITRVLDFGIARATNRSAATRTGQLKGKLRYMAPEQLRGAVATRRSDIYAAGVVLWEALTTLKLWNGETDAAIYGQVLEGLIAPPSKHVPSAAPLDHIVLRALARDPLYRYETALTMAEAIEAAIPIAPASQVSAFLEKILDAPLRQRARKVAVIEGRASQLSIPDLVIENDETVTEAPSALDDAPTGTMRKSSLTVGATVPPPASVPPRASNLGAFIAFGLAGALLAGAVAAYRASPRSVAVPARRGIAETALMVVLRARMSAMVDAPAEPKVIDLPDPPPNDDAAAPSASASGAPPKHTPSARAKSQCDPPYTIDGLGILRAKPGCL